MRISPVQWALLGAIILIALILRFAWIGSGEAHFDELWFLEISTGRGTAHSTMPLNVLIPDAPDPTSLNGAPPWWQIWTRMTGATHPPLHFLLLRGWRAMLGESVAVGRALSAVLSVGCVLALFWVCRTLHGTIVALWAALLLALSSAQIEIAQEVRNYPTMMLAALIAAAILVRGERDGQMSVFRSTMLCVAALGMLLTHYFTAPLLGVLGIYALIRLRGRNRWRAVGALAVAIIVFLMLWYPAIQQQRTAFAIAAGPGALGDDAAHHVTATLRRAAMIPLRLLFEPRKDVTFLPLLSASLYLLPWLLLRRRMDLLLWATWLPAVVGFAMMLDLARGTKHLEQLRHTIDGGPAVCAVLAIFAGNLGMRYVKLVPPLAALACVGALGQTYLRQNPQYSDLGKYLTTDAAGRSDPIVFYSDPSQTWRGEWLYVGAAHYSGTFPRPIVRVHAPVPPDVLEHLKAFPELWLISAPTNLKPTEIIPGTREIDMKGNPYLGTVTRLQWKSSSAATSNETPAHVGQPR